LNLNISASRQNIKNLVGNFGAIYVGNMHANFQVSGSSGVEGGGGDRQKDWRHAVFCGSCYEISILAPSLRFRRVKLKTNIYSFTFQDENKLETISAYWEHGFWKCEDNDLTNIIKLYLKNILSKTLPPDLKWKKVSKIWSCQAKTFPIINEKNEI